MSKWLERLREHEKKKQGVQTGTDKTPKTYLRQGFGGFGGSPDEAFADFEERAAILEYDAGLSRVEAERLARLQISPTRH